MFCPFILCFLTCFCFLCPRKHYYRRDLWKYKHNFVITVLKFCQGCWLPPGHSSVLAGGIRCPAHPGPASLLGRSLTCHYVRILTDCFYFQDADLCSHWSAYLEPVRPQAPAALWKHMYHPWKPCLFSCSTDSCSPTVLATRAQGQGQYRFHHVSLVSSIELAHGGNLINTGRVRELTATGT